MKRAIKKYLGTLATRRAASSRLPEAATGEAASDALGLTIADPGLEATRSAAMDWLCRAQDCSASQDGGVSRSFSLVTGWASSYPETTGYIIPTFLEQAQLTNRPEYRERAVRMLDWLTRIQFPSGAFQGGKIDSVPVLPVAFNTGQILIGLACGEREFGRYRLAMSKAADWLVAFQDPDGCWRAGASPFVTPGDKTYDTHIAWGLFEAARVEPGRGYAEAALRNVRWALRHQRENGWMAQCCLSSAAHPLTHTLGYALRGIVEGYRYSGESEFLNAARRLGSGLLDALSENGHLPGMLREDWTAEVNWACLTGTVQVAWCWLALYEVTGDRQFRDAAYAANAYVRRTVRVRGESDTCGAVKGSFPIDGGYGRFEYPNWAAKFLVDALTAEERVRAADRVAVVA